MELHYSQLNSILFLFCEKNHLTICHSTLSGSIHFIRIYLRTDTVTTLSALPRLLTTPTAGNICRFIQRRNVTWDPAPESKLKYHMISSISSENSLYQKPTVLMIGWAGAASKHMEKYTQIYNDKGFNVISICPPLFHFKVPDKAVATAQNGPRESLLTLPHQNGTAMMLSRPAVAYLSDKTRSKIHELTNSIRDVLTPLINIFPFLRHRFLYWYFVDKIQLPKQQLYLYSHGDTMVPFGPLEEFIEIQKSRGCLVDSVNFGDTEHVAHFRSKPKDYSNKCIEFVSKL